MFRYCSELGELGGHGTVPRIRAERRGDGNHEFTAKDAENAARRWEGMGREGKGREGKGDVGIEGDTEIR